MVDHPPQQVANRREEIGVGRRDREPPRPSDHQRIVGGDVVRTGDPVDEVVKGERLGRQARGRNETPLFVREHGVVRQPRLQDQYLHARKCSPT